MIINGHKIYFCNKTNDVHRQVGIENIKYYAIYLLYKDPRYNTKVTNRLCIETMTKEQIIQRFEECNKEPKYICRAIPRATTRTRPRYLKGE